VIVMTSQQLTGQSETHLLELSGLRMQADALKAWLKLRKKASSAGFDLRVASGFRSFARQQKIWNEKLLGQRPVLDDKGIQLDLSKLNEKSRLEAVLRFSALPGASRHHWGTDIDVYDGLAIPDVSAVQLVPDETISGGVFALLHEWLDEQFSKSEGYGFFRPYDKDRGGVAIERWHLSYAPVARQCQRIMSVDLLRDLIRREDMISRELLEECLDDIYQRFIEVPYDCYPV